MRSIWAVLTLVGCAWVSPADEQAALLRAEPVEVRLVDGPSEWSACRDVAITVEVDARLDGETLQITPVLDGLAGDVQAVSVEQGVASVVLSTAAWAPGPRSVGLLVGLADGPRTDVLLDELEDLTPYGYVDADADGAAGSEQAVDCEGLLPQAATDCDDADPAAYPGGPELVADGVDGDCDGEELCYVDGDGDGFAGETTGTVGGSLDCGVAGLYDIAEDCDDGDPDVAPGAVERCDGVDSDCDGSPGPDELDADSDGYVACDGIEGVLDGDCDDEDPDRHPGATELVANGVDEDCDGAELCYVDDDLDGFGGADTVAGTDFSCTDPYISSVDTDCDDDAAGVYPGATEVCDGVLEDCNTQDEEPSEPIGVVFSGQPAVPVATMEEALALAGSATAATLHICDAVGDPDAVYRLEAPGTLVGHESPELAGTVESDDDLRIEGLRLVGGPGVLTTLSYGGALYVSAATVVTAVDVEIDCTDSAYLVQGGGGVFVQAGGALVAQGLEVHDCDSLAFGGAIDNRGDLTIDGGALYRNESQRGGAIYSLDPIHLTDVDIYENIAATQGAGVHLATTNAVSVLVDVLFRDNELGSGNDVDIYANEADLELTDVRFEPMSPFSVSQRAIGTRGAITATRMEMVPGTGDTSIDVRVPADNGPGAAPFVCTDCVFEADTTFRQMSDGNDSLPEYVELFPTGTFTQIECLQGAGACTVTP